jgi:hypothetical protein
LASHIQSLQVKQSAITLLALNVSDGTLSGAVAMLCKSVGNRGAIHFSRSSCDLSLAFQGVDSMVARIPRLQGWAVSIQGVPLLRLCPQVFGNNDILYQLSANENAFWKLVSFFRSCSIWCSLLNYQKIPLLIAAKHPGPSLAYKAQSAAPGTIPH